MLSAMALAGIFVVVVLGLAVVASMPRHERTAWAAFFIAAAGFIWLLATQAARFGWWLGSL